MKKILEQISKKIMLFILLFIISIHTNGMAAEAQSKKVIRVAFPQVPGISVTYDDGTRDGVLFEWLMEIAKYTGWEYEFIVKKDLNTVVSEMYNDEYDLMGNVFQIPELEELFYYPDYMMGVNYSSLFYDKEDKLIKSFDVRTIDGKTIGVFDKAAVKIDRLQNVLEFHGIHCDFKYYDNEKDFENAIVNDEVDLLLASDMYNKGRYNVALRFASEPCYIIVQKKDAELAAQLNDAIEKIYSINPNFGADLFQKYFPVEYNNVVVFSDAEKSFVKQHKQFKIAVVNDSYPFYYIHDETAKGIVPELMSIINAQTGVDFEYVAFDFYDQAIEAVKNGNADVLGYFISESSAVGIEEFYVTKNYLMADTMILRNKQVSLSDKDLVEAAIIGSGNSHGIKNKGTVYFNSYEECLEAVNAGKAGYTSIPYFVLESLYMSAYYSNMVPVNDGPKAYLSLAVNKDNDIRMYSILNKALTNVTEQQKIKILVNSSLTSADRPLSFKSVIYSNPLLTIMVLLIVMVIIGAMYLWFRMKNQIIYLQMQQMEYLSKIRSEFLSRMSHEIRTPLNAIIGLANLMRLSSDPDPKRKRNTLKIYSSAKFLLSLINDVLDMSKIESGKMKIEKLPFSIEQMRKQLEDIFIVMTEEKGIALEFKCNVINKNFMGSELRLKQVLTNLISNAYKFTNCGSITVTITETPKDDDISVLNFNVKDTGIGICKEDLKRIFSSFEQVVRKSRSNNQGTGLGLTISRNLVSLMGGELSVESEVKQGSEFFFSVELPVYKGEIEVEHLDADKMIKHSKLHGKTILLAEDNDLNAEIAVVLLEMQDVKVKRVTNGQLVVEQFINSSGNPYDLILMDLQMPVMNGLEAAEKIRSLEQEHAKSIPIVALSANSTEEDKEKALKAGMNGFISKPFDVEEFYRQIENFF